MASHCSRTVSMALSAASAGGSGLARARTRSTGFVIAAVQCTAETAAVTATESPCDRSRQKSVRQRRVAKQRARAKAVVEGPCPCHWGRTPLLCLNVLIPFADAGAVPFCKQRAQSLCGAVLHRACSMPCPMHL